MGDPPTLFSVDRALSVPEDLPLTDESPMPYQLGTWAGTPAYASLDARRDHGRSQSPPTTRRDAPPDISQDRGRGGRHRRARRDPGRPAIAGLRPGHQAPPAPVGGLHPRG